MRRKLTLANAVNELIAKGYTQTELSDLLGVSPSVICNWSNGKTKTTRRFSTVVKFLNLLEDNGIPSSELRAGIIPQVFENTTKKQRETEILGKSAVSKYMMPVTKPRKPPEGATHIIGSEYVRIVRSKMHNQTLYMQDWGDGWRRSSWVEENRLRAVEL